MPAMKRTSGRLHAAGLTLPRIIIGGGPVTQRYADEIGADAYAPDAASAVEVGPGHAGPPPGVDHDENVEQVIVIWRTFFRAHISPTAASRGRHVP